MKRVKAGVLDIAYLESGPEDGPPVILLHGFPYDVHAFEGVAHRLASAGYRTFTPYLRGFGPTRFLSVNTLRSGQQGAIAHDLLEFMNALAIPQATLAGFDWGGRAACIVAALWPDRVKGLVSAGGYTIQDIAAAGAPQIPENEFRLWYQYYFHGARGRAGLERYREEFCSLLWRLWSPEWNFSNEDYARTAQSFANPDFVDIVIHSYRHRFGLVESASEYEETESRLAAQPQIGVPTIAIDGGSDGVAPLGGSANHDRYFTGYYERRVLPGIGHNPPQEAPEAFASAILALQRKTDLSRQRS